jgi:uncharacterized membrane protein YccC
LKGCLAASACYVIYNSIDWQGIGTPAVITCLFTALSTIGSSRQKQALRLSGFLVGGLILGMGAQIFVLPYLDSIFGFTILSAQQEFDGESAKTLDAIADRMEGKSSAQKGDLEQSFSHLEQAACRESSQQSNGMPDPRVQTLLVLSDRTRKLTMWLDESV